MKGIAVFDDGLSPLLLLKGCVCRIESEIDAVVKSKYAKEEERKNNESKTRKMFRSRSRRRRREE